MSLNVSLLESVLLSETAGLGRLGCSIFVLLCVLLEPNSADWGNLLESNSGWIDVDKG